MTYVSLHFSVVKNHFPILLLRLEKTETLKNLSITVFSRQYASLR